jgi:predicted metal-binding membrane protein
MPSSRASTLPRAVSSINGEGAGTSPARRRPPIERLLSRSGLIAAAAMLIAVVLAWRWLLASGMSAMPMDGHVMAPIHPWSFSYLVPAFAMWSVMMVAMMLPSAAPMILLHARIDRAPTSGRRLVHSLIFAGAYLLVWTGFSAIAALAQALLIDLGLLSGISLAVGDRMLAAALLVVAALYQFSPAKAACLDQCRSPIHFVMRYWSPGVAGALRLGLVHGLACVGCCWGLMLLLFVAGVMNLAWVAALAAVVLAEKLAAPKWQASKVIAALLFVGAVVLVATGA